MKKQVEDFITSTYLLFRTKEEFDMEIKQVLSFKNDDGTMGYQAIAVSYDSPDEIRCVCENVQENLEYQIIPEWDYNIDDYLLDDLENGYEIEYMTLDEHYGIWHSIDNMRNEISHTDGLQKYLSYCRKNEISSQVISLFNKEHIDIFDLYQESNGPYKIIAETNIGNRTIVLGHSTISPSPYVTWDTTPARKHGYDAGHYFSSYTEAFKDYKKRCEHLLDRHLQLERNMAKPVKKDNGYER